MFIPTPLTPEVISVSSEEPEAEPASPDVSITSGELSTDSEYIYRYFILGSACDPRVYDPEGAKSMIIREIGVIKCPKKNKKKTSKKNTSKKKKQ